MFNWINVHPVLGANKRFCQSKFIFKFKLISKYTIGMLLSKKLEQLFGEMQSILV